MEDPVGLEPTALGLKVPCTTYCATDPYIWCVRMDSNQLAHRERIYSPSQPAVVAAHANWLSTEVTLLTATVLSGQPLH